MFFKKKFLRIYKQKLKRSQKKFNQRLKEERNAFISILNHDIKTPILAQKQSLEFVLKNLPNGAKQEKEILKDTIASNNFLLEVVINTIFLTKYENEKPNLNLEKVDIIEQIKDCASLIKTQANDKNQNIIIKSNKNKNINLSADRKMVQKIIFNILTSSLNYGFENSDIEVLVKENKKTISFYTKNKSVYMTKEKINSLFDKKQSTKDFNQLGMSLNLSIAKKLINAHSWDIVAKSTKDNESVFGFVVKKN